MSSTSSTLADQMVSVLATSSLEKSVTKVILVGWLTVVMLIAIAVALCIEAARKMRTDDDLDLYLAWILFAGAICAAALTGIGLKMLLS